MEYQYTKEPSQELLELCKNKVYELEWYEDNWFDGCVFNIVFDFENVKYSFIERYEDNWEDKGKYQCSNIVYQLVSYDNSEIRYPCGMNIIDEFNLFFKLPVTNYYGGYYCQYDKPIVMKCKTIHVPEQIIPAHDTIELEEID